MRVWRSALIAAIAVLGLTTVATATNGPAPHVGAALSSDVQFFYYPWYGNPTVAGAYRHWQQGGHNPPADIGSNYYPVNGA